MRKCPNCEKSTAAIIYGTLERGSDGKTLSHYRRNFRCKTCGHKFTTYEFYFTPAEKTNLLRLARLGREFIEFKAEWKEALQDEIDKRAESRAELQKLRADKKSKKQTTEEDYDELLDLENIIIEGEEDNE